MFPLLQGKSIIKYFMLFWGAEMMFLFFPCIYAEMFILCLCFTLILISLLGSPKSHRSHLKTAILPYSLQGCILACNSFSFPVRPVCGP